MNTPKHTKTPWIADGGEIQSDNGRGWKAVAECTANNLGSLAVEPEEAEANAALIVRAVNAHDALVEALEALMAAAPAHRSGKRDGATMGRISIAMDKAEAALRAAKEEV